MGTAGHSAVATGPEHRTPGGTDGARGPHRAGLRGRFPPALHAPCSEEPVRGQAGTRSYGHSTVPWAVGPAFTGLCAVPSAPVPFAPVGPGPTPKAQRLPEVFAVRQRAGMGKQTPVHCDGAATRGRLAICSGNRSRAEPGHRGTGDGGRLRSPARSQVRTARLRPGPRTHCRRPSRGHLRPQGQGRRPAGQQATRGRSVRAPATAGWRPSLAQATSPQAPCGGSSPDRLQCGSRGVSPPWWEQGVIAASGKSAASGVGGLVSCGQGGRRPEQAPGTRDSAPRVLGETGPEPARTSPTAVTLRTTWTVTTQCAGFHGFGWRIFRCLPSGVGIVPSPGLG